MNVKPFSQEALSSLRDAAYTAKEKGVYFCNEQFPSKLVYMSTTTKVVIWKVERRVVNINSKMTDFSAGPMSFPDMIFMVKEQELSAWAVDGEDLYMLCLPNYDNETGFVCVDINEKLNNVIEVMNNTEQSFFRSVFQGWSHNSESPEYKHLITTLYKLESPWLKGKKGKTIKKLKMFDQSLSELISSII